MIRNLLIKSPRTVFHSLMIFLIVVCTTVFYSETAFTQFCNPPTITTQPENVGVCNGFGAYFQVLGYSHAGWQWQVNTGDGSGFTNIVNNSVYNGADLNILDIYSVTPEMSGYTYRVIVLGSSPTCFTTSQSASLTVSNLSLTAVLTNPTCSNAANGSIDITTTTGGGGSYYYHWGQNWEEEDDLMNASAGNYHLYVMDWSGCPFDTTFTLTAPAPVNVGTVAQGNPYCYGFSNGYAEVNSTGGTGSHSYSWSPSGHTSAMATGLGGGVHTVTVTDQNGCTGTRNFTIVEPQPLTATFTTSSPSCTGFSNGSVTVAASGGPNTNYTYNVSGFGNSNFNTVNWLPAGNHTLSVYSGFCTFSQSFTITPPAPLVSQLVYQADVLCANGFDGVAAVTASGGTGNLTYSWSASPETGPTATSLTAGPNQVTVTDGNGCVSTQSFTLNEPQPLNLAITSTNGLLCGGTATGTAAVTASGGTGSYSYEWSESQEAGNSAADLPGGYNEVTVTDENGCTNTQSFTLSAPQALTAIISHSDITCHGDTDGAVEVNVTGGAGNYTYSWSGYQETGNEMENLTAGTYEVTVTDGNGCEATAQATIVEPAPLVNQIIAHTNVQCNGMSNGTVGMGASGGTGFYSFSWSSSASTDSYLLDLAAGQHEVTITDENGCSIVQAFTISEPAPLTAVIDTVHNVTCHDEADGALYIGITGGTPHDLFGSPYYSPTIPDLPPTAGGGPTWPEGNMVQYLVGLTGGTYDFIFTDYRGCTVSVSVPVGEPAELVGTLVNSTDVTCYGVSNGTAEVAATGGSGNYTFYWGVVGSGLEASPTALPEGDVYVYITDENNCVDQVEFQIDGPDQIVITPETISDVSCHGESDGSLEVSVSGGESPYSVNYGGPNEGLPAGEYPVTVTDDSGCSVTAFYTITQPELITTYDYITICAGDSVIVGGVTYYENAYPEVTYTSSNGCDSIVNTIIYFAELHSDIVEQDGVLEIEDNEEVNYQWFDCQTGLPLEGETSGQLTAPYSGSFYAIVSLGDCSRTSECVEVAYAGLSENSSLNAGLSPNPSNGTFTVSWKQGITNATIVITDVTGKIVYGSPAEGNSNVIDLDQSAGVYYVTVSSGSMRQVLKAVLN